LPLADSSSHELALIHTDADMNTELIAHGFSNGFSGLFGGELIQRLQTPTLQIGLLTLRVVCVLPGLQNYLCYSNSVLYAKSGGQGKAASLAVAAGLMILFFVGPHIGTYIPRCMAGTILLHMGIDLMTEGFYDCKSSFSVEACTSVALNTF
jgi:sulfate permease, SulP family